MNKLFDLPTRDNIDESSLISKLKPVEKSQPRIKLGRDSLLTAITNIKNMVEFKLGKYKDDYLLLNNKNEKEIEEYFDKILENKKLSIDLETTGLNLYEDKIVGVCLYTPNMKSCYIPIRHKSYLTGEDSQSNVEVEFIIEQFKKLENKPIYTIYHNAKFDYKFLLQDFKIKLNINYDTMIAAKLLNNLEPASLKFQYAKYVEETNEFSTFGDLFNGISFDYIPANVGYIYGAKDAQMTYDLMLYQKAELEKVPNVKWVFDNIEMPLIEAVAETEMNGIEIDMIYTNELKIKYENDLKRLEKDCYEELNKYKIEIDSYIMKNKTNKLSNPINLASPTQLAIVLYDILKNRVVDKKSPRGTGIEILEQIKIPFCKKLLEYRAISKILSTYIESLPKEIKQDGRIHASFNQMGTDTGRFSSSNPNLQNIPSKNQEIRKMFKAKDNYLLIGSDFSQQEPRLLAEISQDEGLLTSYREGKDIYAYIASIAFKRPYDECKEFRPDGSKNPEGKKFRTQAKAITLGLMYSKGVDAVAVDLGITKQEAENVFNSFFRAFPSVEKFVKNTQESVRKKGYTETFFGRRRQIPDMLLEPISITSNGISLDYDPTNFDDDFDSYELTTKEKNDWIKKYKSVWNIAQKQQFRRDALENNGITIKDSTMLIQKAERQCVNAVIQGTAADQSKIAIIKLFRNKELRDLGYKLQLYVHDEIIGECPKENAKRCGEIVQEIMENSVADWMKVPFNCDAEYSTCWNGEQIKL